MSILIKSLGHIELQHQYFFPCHIHLNGKYVSEHDRKIFGCLIDSLDHPYLNNAWHYANAILISSQLSFNKMPFKNVFREVSVVLCKPHCIDKCIYAYQAYICKSTWRACDTISAFADIHTLLCVRYFMVNKISDRDCTSFLLLDYCIAFWHIWYMHLTSDSFLPTAVR